MLCLFRTRQMCLMWVIPMRDLLPLLKRHPQLYHKACSQVVPKVLMDYLTISPLEVSISQTKKKKKEQLSVRAILTGCTQAMWLSFWHPTCNNQLMEPSHTNRLDIQSS